MSTPTRKVAASKPSKPTSSSSTVKNVPKQAASTNDNTIFKVNFEIRGKVQGTSLGIRGWCQNTEYNTVIGCMEGPRLKIEQM
ncbi:unnamed protein product [Orchesella dallaii]|uniref:Acylphosphatase n=1 Tax=Orchesella dallaii TaxID=48710 RepID=A0ABP1QTU9_9HEXA